MGAPCKKVNYKGKIYDCHVLARQVKMNRDTLYSRLFTYGWTVERAVETPIGNKFRAKNTTVARKKIELKIKKINRGVDEFNFVMRRFYTKHQRLESYKRLIKDIKEMRMKIAA